MSGGDDRSAATAPEAYMAVMEIVRITCQEGQGDAFVQALKSGLGVQAADRECLSAEFLRGVERPDEFILQIAWTSVEAHQAWRSAKREEWRSHIWHLIEGTPQLLGHYVHQARVKGS